MGAYFTLQAEKKSLPLFAEADRVIDPKITLRSGKLMARAFADSFKGDQRETIARTFLTAIIQTYWNKLQEPAAKRFSLPPFFRRQTAAELPDAAWTLARTMGEAASLLEPLAASYLISVTYTAMLPEDTRSRLGAYYTPPPLAERLVVMATSAGVNWSTCRVLDPACGGGAFLSAVAAPLAKACGQLPAAHILSSIADRLQGFEVDPFAAWLSQTFLEACLMPLCQRAGERLPVLVHVRDSLTTQEPDTKDEHYDLVIDNPPYGRVSLAARIRDRFRRSLYGHANLYGVFTDLAVRLAKPGAVIAYVTPTSFLAGEYFKALRSLLAQFARPVNIDFVSVRKGVFDDALQETMLATYRKTGVYLNSPTVHFIAPTKHDSISVEKGGDFELPKGGGPWLVPRSHEQAQLIASLRLMHHRLRDYGYKVSTGPLVWNRHKSQLVSKNSAKNIFPLIWAEAVTPDGRFQFRADKKNHLPYFKTRERDEWLITRTACVLLQRTTAKEQSRRLIAASLPAAFIREHGAVVIENHLNMIRPINGSPPVPAGLLAAVLNTAIVDRAFRCISGSVAVSAYELENLPLPPPADLKSLVGRAARRDAVEEACLRLYHEARKT
jgi:adenine-specific DNA-methyltransferase